MKERQTTYQNDPAQNQSTEDLSGVFLGSHEHACEKEKTATKQPCVHHESLRETSALSSPSPALQNSWNETAACISHIFSKTSQNDFPSLEKSHAIEVRPRYLKFRSPQYARPGRKPLIESRRSKISGFSRQSRGRMIQMMASLEDYPNFWQDFTFADDVMEDRSISERAKYSSAVLKKFKQKIEPLYPSLSGVWRREWEKRKSGAIKGNECPHFHMLLKHPDINEQNYKGICIDLALNWVNVTKTKDREKAFRVALNPKSYRWLHDQNMAQIYVSKYIAKIEQHGRKESRGRYWGKIGDLNKSAGVVLKISEKESVKLRRLLRTKIRDKDKSKMLYRSLKNLNRSGWMLISAETVSRMLEWIKQTNTVDALAPTAGEDNSPF